MKTAVKLTDEQTQESTRLYQEYGETIRISASRAKSSWCASYEYDDLLQEGFMCLLSCAGFLDTPGKYDPTRVGPRGKATFKTYLITSLFNWYRDMGAASATQARHVTFVSEYPDQPISDAAEVLADEQAADILYTELWRVLSPVARVILDVRWCSYPQRVPLTKIAPLLSVPYDTVLLANAEIQEKLSGLRYNNASKGETGVIENDCFGLHPNGAASECNACVDFDACSKVRIETGGTVPSGVPRSFMLRNTAMSDAPATAAPTVPAEKKVRRTMMDVAFEKLMSGPHSREELAQSIANEFPANKGTRAADLIVALRAKGHLEDHSAVKENVVDGEATKEVSVRRHSLKEGAVEALIASNELICTEVEGKKHYHLALRAA